MSSATETCTRDFQGHSITTSVGPLGDADFLCAIAPYVQDKEFTDFSDRALRTLKEWYASSFDFSKPGMAALREGLRRVVALSGPLAEACAKEARDIECYTRAIDRCGKALIKDGGNPVQIESYVTISREAGDLPESWSMPLSAEEERQRQKAKSVRHIFLTFLGKSVSAPDGEDQDSGVLVDMMRILKDVTASQCAKSVHDETLRLIAARQELQFPPNTFITDLKKGYVMMYQSYLALRRDHPKREGHVAFYKKCFDDCVAAMTARGVDVATLSLPKVAPSPALVIPDIQWTSADHDALMAQNP